MAQSSANVDRSHPITVSKERATAVVLILQSATLCAIFTFSIAFILRDPVKGIMTYPAPIRERAASLPYTATPSCKKSAHIAKRLLTIPACAVVCTLMTLMAGIHSFSTAYLYSMSLFLVVNTWDLVVRDWPWFCHSPRVRIAGTQDMDKEYRDPWHRFRGFGIGIGVGAAVSLLSAPLTAMLPLLSCFPGCRDAHLMARVVAIEHGDALRATNIKQSGMNCR